MAKIVNSSAGHHQYLIVDCALFCAAHAVLRDFVVCLRQQREQTALASDGGQNVRLT